MTIKNMDARLPSIGVGWAAVLATSASLAYSTLRGPLLGTNGMVQVVAIAGTVLGAFLLLRPRPVLAFLVVAVTGWALTLARPDSLVGYLVPGWLVLVAGYHLGRRASLLWALVTTKIAFATTLAVNLWTNVRVLRRPLDGVELPYSTWQLLADLIPGAVSIILLPVLVGMVVRTQGERLELSAQVLERERAAKAEAVEGAVRSDRQRMAHELHDLAAHHTTAVVINAKAAQKLAERDPATARALLDDIVDQAQAAQLSLRQMVQVLTGDELAPLEPQPRLEEIADLVEHGRAINPDLVLELEPTAVSAPVAVAAYRIVQESLTNAHRYAPGAPVTVLVGPSDDDEVLLVEVRNGAAATGEIGLGTGHGIDGMRMRAKALGGTLVAGPYGQGWRVLAELPLRGEEVA